MGSGLTFLGIESSCDDTAAAVVRHAGRAQSAEILSSVVEGQTALHAAFGGVVPRSPRAPMPNGWITAWNRRWPRPAWRLRDLDGIAVTAGPGLIGGVLSGVMLAKGLAAATGLPLVGVNHLAGHALTPRLTDQLAFPYLMLLVSGGHCQFLIVHGAERFSGWAAPSTTRRARLLTRRQSCWACRSRAARPLRPRRRWAMPGALPFRARCWTGPGCDMSFSGLKTALLRARDAVIAEKGGITVQDRRDLCAGFQAAVADVLAEKTRRALASLSGAAPGHAGLGRGRRCGGKYGHSGQVRDCFCRCGCAGFSRRHCGFAPTMPR